jgi:hypothetical protein
MPADAPPARVRASFTPADRASGNALVLGHFLTDPMRTY